MKAESVEKCPPLDKPPPCTHSDVEFLLGDPVVCGIDTILGRRGGSALPFHDALHGQPAIRIGHASTPCGDIS